jgi:hypothetical protein
MLPGIKTLASGFAFSYSHFDPRIKGTNMATYFFALALIPAVMGLLLLFSRSRRLQAAEQARISVTVDAARYAPMARLLADDDLKLLGDDRELIQTLRRQRCDVFRGYLRCLTKDYGALLGGIRNIMVHSDRDRPDLARLLARSERRFLFALCRIEIQLFLYRFGLGTVNIDGLLAQVTAMGQLRPAITA